jgi:hypothetical protein
MSRPEFDLPAQIVCVRREIRYRKFVFAKRVAAGTMTTLDAERELAAMEAVLNTLLELQSRADPDLFSRIQQPTQSKETQPPEEK